MSKRISPINNKFSLFKGKRKRFQLQQVSVPFPTIWLNENINASKQDSSVSKTPLVQDKRSPFKFK